MTIENPTTLGEVAEKNLQEMIHPQTGNALVDAAITTASLPVTVPMAVGEELGNKFVKAITSRTPTKSSRPR
jgi:hypothetical protein